MHAVGASMFFLAVYLHMFRGLYYGSYKAPREILWILGVLIFLLMMATGFMGYTLPWGQMSFWGATVITNFFSVLDSIVPGAGTAVVEWLLGGYAVGNATLNRFFSLHYLLPFAIAGLVVLHIWALHVTGNNNPTGIAIKQDSDAVPFAPYITIKDGFALALFCDRCSRGSCSSRRTTSDTPTTISAPTRCRHRRTSSRSGTSCRSTRSSGRSPRSSFGVILMFASIAVLFVVPWLDTSRVRSTKYRPIYRWFFWLFVITCLALGYLGSKPAEGEYVFWARIFTAYYFIHFLIIMPIVGLIETPRPMPNSITESVLGKLGGGAMTGGAVPAAAGAHAAEKR